MRKHLLALAISGAALGIGAGPAMADEPVSSQTAGQFAGSVQSAESNATSTQYNPSNTNIDVRVLSPGDDGSVSQENNSYADAEATNDNDTDQSIDQSQSGGGGGYAEQAAGQEAVNLQKAEADAESVQVKPSNKNINVRVLSPGDNGDVSQENNSKAKSKAENDNDLDQDIDQEQGGGYGDMSYGSHDSYKEKDDCGCKDGGTGIQAAGQKAINKQYADADAKSVQIKPSNTNISVRVLSPGDDGDVSQENNSYADADAKNDNDTKQDIEQTQGSFDCGCHGGNLIQAAGQAAFNWQDADADAVSFQFKPENNAYSQRVKSWGDGGGLSQSNNSWADAFSRNENDLYQDVDQTQGG
jgi:hypothetical protein